MSTAVVEYCGEQFPLGMGARFSIGREADLTIEEVAPDRLDRVRVVEVLREELFDETGVDAEVELHLGGRLISRTRPPRQHQAPQILRHRVRNARAACGTEAGRRRDGAVEIAPGEGRRVGACAASRAVSFAGTSGGRGWTSAFTVPGAGGWIAADCRRIAARRRLV